MGSEIIVSYGLLSLLGSYANSIYTKIKEPIVELVNTGIAPQIEALRKDYPQLQSIRSSWISNKNNKETPAEKGKSSINLIRDYSFSLLNRCLIGTIWILDYELPKNGGYPTKFFFGTNAHVASGIKFDPSNPYNQVLPINSKCSSSTTTIFRETDLDYLGDRHFMRSLWTQEEKGYIAPNPKNNVERWVKSKREPSHLYYTTEDIKLAYVATNFAGVDNSKWSGCNRKGEKYISDFAVIEIDFKDPRIAKKMTRDFHTKYNYKTGTHKDKAINFFSKPLLERKTNKQMYEENPDIFLAGYPSNGLKLRSVGNYDLEKKQASKLAYISGGYMIKTEDGDEIIGHSSTCHLPNPPGGYELERLPRGLELFLIHEPLEGGSSGSLTTDGEGNALGIKSRKGGNISAVDVFRSSEIKHKGEIVIPEYDLLEGVENNPHDRSYKDSIVEYFLKNNRKTHLSEMRNWGKDKQDKRNTKKTNSPKKNNRDS